MVNGKQGDHSINDIVDHRLPVFSPEIDDMVRRVAALVPRYRMWDMFDWFSRPPLGEFERRVREVLESLERDAEERGWQIQR